QPGRSGLAQLLHCLAALAAEGVSFHGERLFDGRDVKRLNLRGLEPAEGTSKTSSALWLVDGGRALPARSAAEVSPSTPVELDGVIMNREDTELVRPSVAEHAPPVKPTTVVSSRPPPHHSV